MDQEGSDSQVPDTVSRLNAALEARYRIESCSETLSSVRLSDSQNISITARWEMTISESSRVGKRGTLVIPARLRRRFGIEEGSEVIAEETPEGILIRPAVTVPIELYSKERSAGFLLSNAVDAEDYERARQDVRAMGLDPADVDHDEPAGP